MVKPTVSALQKKKRNIRSKTGSKAQSKQILTNLKSIEYLKDQNRVEKTQYGMYHECTNYALTNYQVCQLNPALTAGVNSPQWRNCWSDSALTLQAMRVTMGRIYLNMQFTSYSSLNPVTITVLHVRLQKDTADQLIETLGTDLAGLDALQYRTRGITGGYVQGQATTNGMIAMNPKYIDVKKKWIFTLSGRLSIGPTTNDSSVPTSSYKNIQYDFPTGYRFGFDRGAWSQYSADEACRAEMKNYILVFTDQNTALATKPSMSIFAQCTATGLL